MTKKGWKNFFKSHHIFEELTLVSLEKLFYLIELKILSRNQTIFKEGEAVNGFYLVYQGEVSLTKKIECKYSNDFDMDKFLSKSKQAEGNNYSLAGSVRERFCGISEISSSLLSPGCRL